MFWAIVTILLNLVAVLITLYIIETRWPTLNRILKAAAIVTVLVAIAGILRTWICSWLCA